MKTSSKILTGLLSTIFIVILAIIFDFRVFGEHRSDRADTSKTEDILIGDFKHVRLDHFKSLKIAHSDRNYIQYVVFNDTVVVNIKYTIENDTLKINGESLKSFASYTLFTNSKIKSIGVTHSQINISGLSQDNIHLHLSDGEINSYGSSIKSHFKNATITQVNSRLFFNKIKVDTVELTMENSNARFGKDINSLKASVDSLSRLDLKYVSKLKLIRDKNSKVYMR